MIAKFNKSLGNGEPGNALLGLAGCLLLALGMTLFLQPNRIASGGTPGMAILLAHLTGLPAGGLMLLINLPLLLLGGFCLGRGFVWRTVAAVAVISGLVDLGHELLRLPAVTTSPLLAALGGGALIGVGVGLILKGKASAGGPTILARILADRGWRPGTLLMMMDAVIVAASAWVFGNLDAALYSLLSVMVTGRCIDLVLKKNELRAPTLAAPDCPGSPVR